MIFTRCQQNWDHRWLTAIFDSVSPAWCPRSKIRTNHLNTISF